jgi:23S rRNA pseudouridine1911/1915/1917 synthase
MKWPINAAQPRKQPEHLQRVKARLRVSDRLEAFMFEKEEKERLDVFLTACLPEFSRSRIQGLIRDGSVCVGGEPVTKTGRDLETGEHVEIRIPAPVPSGLVAENIQLDIIFENGDLLVVNKPAGMVVHPSPGHDSGTLVHAVLGHVPELEGIGGEERPGIVHRLDKETSGLIVIAKNEQAHRWLQDQFRNRTVEKIYLALVDGKPPTPSGRVEAPIGRNSTHRKLMSVVPLEKGRAAVSEYKTLESFPEHTLLEVHPLTGRTHQIRVHMAFLRCPVVGDGVYGKKKSTVHLNRHFLHARKLKIILPGEKTPRVFEAPLPNELDSVLKVLRGKE